MLRLATPAGESLDAAAAAQLPAGSVWRQVARRTAFYAVGLAIAAWLVLRGYKLEPVDVHALFPAGPRPSAKVRAFVDYLASSLAAAQPR